MINSHKNSIDFNLYHVNLLLSHLTNKFLITNIKKIVYIYK